MLPAALAAVDPTLAVEAVTAGQGVLRAGADAAVEALKEKQAPEKSGSRPPGSVDDIEIFREELAAILKVLPIEAVVVFVDDLDRCLPPTIIATFEALRLFLHTPKTAHVVAVSREIVEAAIDSRYPDVRREAGAGAASARTGGGASFGIGHEYLEKMLQPQVRVPELSRVDIETYVNFLLTQRRIDGDAFLDLVAALKASRRDVALPPPYNAGVAADLLDDAFTTELAEDLAWGSGICEVAAAGLRGNPRQLKRFLNDLTWRMRAAARRDIVLEPNVLAKLMVLDEQFPDDFQQPFDWQQAAGGPAAELKLAEEIALGISKVATSSAEDKPAASKKAVAARRPAAGSAERTAPAKNADDRSGAAGADADDEVAARAVDPALEAAANQWASRPRLAAWLRLAPLLGEFDLRMYFSYFRDRIVIGSVGSTLDSKLQTLLSRIVQEENSRNRRTAIEELGTLKADEREAILSAVLESATRSPDSNAFRAAAEIGGRHPNLGETVCGAFRAIPHQSLVPGRMVGALAQLKDVEGWDELVAAWKASAVPGVASLAAVAGGRPGRAG
ncbi:MAG: P-loop NTPase fold protein [Marmoricola sp.]